MTRTSTLGLPTSIQAIWKPRGENIERLAARVVSWAEGMRELDPRFAKWHPDMNSRRTAITRPFDLTDNSIAESLILKFREMSDGPDPEPIPGWGFSPGAWTPMADDDDADVGFLTSIGKAKDSPQHFFESFKFDWSQSAPFAHDWKLTAKAIHVLANAWEPLHCECAGYWHPKAKQHRVRWDVWTPAVGWMLYLPDRQLSRSDVPSAADVQPCGTQGTLVLVREHPINMDNRHDLELSDRVRRELQLALNYTIV